MQTSTASAVNARSFPVIMLLHTSRNLRQHNGWGVRGMSLTYLVARMPAYAPAIWLLTDVHYLCAKDNVLLNALFARKASQRLQHLCSANLVERACAQLVTGVPLI